MADETERNAMEHEPVSAEMEQRAPPREGREAQLQPVANPIEENSMSTEESDSDPEGENVVVSDMKLAVEHNHGFLMMVFFNLFYLIAFAFLLTSATPAPWLRAGSGRQWGVWRETGGGDAPLRVRSISDCSEEKQMWQTMSAFAIIGAFAALVTFLSGLLLAFGRGHIGFTLVWGLYTSMASIVAWSLGVKMYHSNRCGKGAFADGVNRLDAGFALSFIAWALSSLGECLLLIYFYRVYQPNRDSPISHPMRFVFLFVTSVCLLLCIVGSAFTMWEKQFTDKTVRLTLWHTEVIDRPTGDRVVFGRYHYQCHAWTQRLKVAAAFIVMSIIFLFATTMLATASAYRSKYFPMTNVMAILTLIMLFVFWVLMVVMRHRRTCTAVVPAGQSLWVDGGYNGVPSGYPNAVIDWTGYFITEGLGMIIASWCILFVATVVNIVTPPRSFKRAANRKNLRDAKKKKEKRDAGTSSGGNTTAQH